MSDALTSTVLSGLQLPVLYACLFTSDGVCTHILVPTSPLISPWEKGGWTSYQGSLRVAGKFLPNFLKSCCV